MVDWFVQQGIIEVIIGNTHVQHKFITNKAICVGRRYILLKMNKKLMTFVEYLCVHSKLSVKSSKLKETLVKATFNERLERIEETLFIFHFSRSICDHDYRNTQDRKQSHEK